MVAQSLISGRAGGLDHPLSNNNFHVSSYNNAEHGTASIAKPAVKTITNNQVVKAQPVKQKFEPITGHRDIDKFIRYAYKNSQYCLTFGHK